MQNEEERTAFEAEAEARWGQTDAYRAYAATTPAQRRAGAKALETLTDAFAAKAREGAAALDPAVQSLVADWQRCISAHFYPCTTELLAGLGQMYTADERFCANLNAHGDGTAALLSDAIAVYCASNR